MGLDNFGQMNADPTQYMAPMDLYDTIWGGKYHSLPASGSSNTV